MKIKGDASQLPLASQLDSANVARHKEVVTDITTQQTPTALTEAQISPAWQAFAQQPSVASRSQIPVDQQSALRQQMNLANQQLPSGARISSHDLAAQLGIDPTRLAVPNSAQIGTTGVANAPRIATGSPSQSAPLASARTSSGPSAASVRQEASAAFEAVVEQSFMPFDTKSDNMARELAGKPQLLAGLSVSEKARLIEIMKDGSTGNGDEQGILNVLNSAGNVREFQQIMQMAGGADSIRANIHGSEANEFDFLVDKFATGAMTKDHPLREQARGMFERVLHQNHQNFDTSSDNLARDLANNPRLLEALTPLEKGRLVQIMGGGVTSEGDEEGMIKVLRSSSNPNDFWQTVQAAGGAEFINSKVDWKEQGQFDYLIDRFRRQAMTQPQPMMQPQAGLGQTGAAPAMSNINPMNPMAMNPMGGLSTFNPVMGMNPMMGMGMVQNPWSVPPVMGYNTGFGMGMPGFAAGTATGIGNQFDLGIGGTIKRAIGGFFRGLVRGVMNTLKLAINVGVSAGIGFLMGGPAGAAMNAAGTLMGSMGMGGMMGGLGMLMGGMGGGGMMMQTLFSTMMGSTMPMGGLGGAGMLLGMF